MAFYAEFSGYYETVFPFRRGVLEFLDHWLPDEGRLLDIGCGTGAYCGQLNRPGRPCLGLDMDPHMIAEAEKKHPDARFTIMDMESVGLLPAGSFSGIYCIGNVLPHLPSGRLADFLADLRHLLKPGGTWIFQTVNFDPLEGGGDFRFPVRDFPEHGLKFYRAYHDNGDGSLSFQTRLELRGEDVFEGEVPLYPRTSSHCLDLHLAAGFMLAGHFADFEEKPFISHQHSGSVYVFRAPEE
jgi:SAM-dependent methyltransferase